MYNFDLVKVEEIVKKEKETCGEIEDMYSFDLAKVQDSEDGKAPGVAHEAKKLALPEQKDMISIDQHYHPMACEMPRRARRLSAPVPGEHCHPVVDEPCYPPRASWQDAGLRQLAAENRELKQRTAQLESEYQRIAQLAMSAQGPAVSVEAAVASGFAEMD
jgi:hypothetical protein